MNAAFLTPQQGIVYLAQNLSKLDNSTGRRDFAKSLVSQHKNKGTLSGKQWEWVGKLVKMLMNPSEPPKPDADLGGITGIVALFDTVGSKLKNPAITLHMPAHHADIKISRAPACGSNPGFLYVRWDGTYAGKISPTGLLTMNQYVNGPERQALIQLLELFAADPANVAAAHGKLTGKCCFCNTGLTDQKSLDVGYGPTCAKNYGLPWGKEKFSTPAEIDAVNAIVLADAEVAAVGIEEMEDTVLAFEQEQMAEKAARRFADFTPIPGRACKDLLEMMNG